VKKWLSMRCLTSAVYGLSRPIYTLLFFYLEVLTVKHVCESSLLLTGLRFRCYSLAVRQRGIA